MTRRGKDGSGEEGLEQFGDAGGVHVHLRSGEWRL